MVLWYSKGSTLSGNDGAGHVMNVEAFYENGDVLVSESGYGSSNPFWTTRRSNANGRWGMGSGYTYRGCIVNPAIGYKPYEPAPAPTPVDPNTKTYTVVAGDTLSGIASRYGTTYQELARINNIANPNIIHIGQVIVLPAGVAPTQQSLHQHQFLKLIFWLLLKEQSEEISRMNHKEVKTYVMKDWPMNK